MNNMCHMHTPVKLAASRTVRTHMRVAPAHVHVTACIVPGLNFVPRLSGSPANITHTYFIIEQKVGRSGRYHDVMMMSVGRVVRTSLIRSACSPHIHVD